MITKYRAQQVTLDLPTEESEVWIRCMIQKVIKNDDYQTVQTIDRVSDIHRRFSEFMLQTQTLQDPVTGDTLEISGAGLGLAVSAFVKRWMLEDILGTINNEHGDIVKG